MECEQGSESEHDCLCSNDKAFEYYVKYGRQRNLGRFLRIQSQATHRHTRCALRMQEEEQPHCSVSQPTFQRLPLEICDEEQQQNVVAVKSQLINDVNEDKENAATVHEIPIQIETTSKQTKDDRKSSAKTTKYTRKSKNVNLEKSRTLSSTSSSATNDSATLIRIVRESVEAELKRKHKKESKSTKNKYEEQADADDDFHTPPKQEHRNADKALTPESTTKSLRRLEWDSLGDVGYRRSKSQTNISMLERSVLHQLLEDNELNTETERNRRLLEQLLHQKYSAMKRAKSLDSPPLASSTRLEHKINIKNLQEKSVQTTLLKTAKISQQVQANLTKSADFDKYIDSKLTENVSSDSDLTAEYHKNSKVLVGETLLESTSTDDFISVPNPTERIQEQQQDQVLSSLSRSKSLEQENISNKFLFNKSKSCENTSSQLSANDKISGINNLADSSISLEFEEKLQAELMRRHSDSAVNTPAVSKSKSCDQLDLGIELLCALIEARSLSNSEKQRLLTNLVNRISSLCGKKLASYKDITRAEGGKNVSETSSDQPVQEQQSTEAIQTKLSPPTTSAAAVRNKMQIDAQKNMPLEGVNLEKAANLQSDVKNPAAKLRKGEYGKENLPINSSAPEHESSVTKSSSSASDEVLKNSLEELLNNINKEECRTPVWCQPMTLSEIEYERQKYEFEHNADKRRIVLEQPLSAFYKVSDEKREALGNWLDMEISRLERLRKFMLHQESRKSTYTNGSSSVKSETSKAKAQEVFYDQVVSDTRTSNSSQAAADNNSKNSTDRNGVQHVIELVIEQSKENYIKPKEIPNTESALTNIEFALKGRNGKNFKIVKKILPKLKPTTKSSTVAQSTSTTSSSADMVLNVQHRSKMATPIGSSNNSSESVTSFVKQRVRSEKQTQQSLGTQTTTAAEHATQTVPEMQCTCNCNNFRIGIAPNNYYYPYHKWVQPSAGWHCCQHCLSQQCRVPRYYTTPMTQANTWTKQKTASNVSFTKPATATKTTSTSMTEMKKNAATQKPSGTTQSFQSSSTSSGSSKLQSQFNTLAANIGKLSLTSSETSTATTLTGHISSDMSIHIDSQINSTSSTTTTHQYDDLDSIEPSILRQTVAVQTSSTLLHVQTPEMIAPGVQTAPIRLKPKSVAYVLEFHPIKRKSSRNSDEAYESMPEKIIPLQKHLERKNSAFVAHTKQRNALLHRLHNLRLQRERELRELVENNSFSSIERKLKNIPPPATDQIRLFTTKQMKAMTNKRARNLPEVLDREQREREERRRRSNRLLRDLFNRRMQKRVRIGQISLSHSKCVI